MLQSSWCHRGTVAAWGSGQPPLLGHPAWDLPRSPADPTRVLPAGCIQPVQGPILLRSTGTAQGPTSSSRRGGGTDVLKPWMLSPSLCHPVPQRPRWTLSQLSACWWRGAEPKECHWCRQVLCDIRQNRDGEVAPGSEPGGCPAPPGCTRGHRGTRPESESPAASLEQDRGTRRAAGGGGPALQHPLARQPLALKSPPASPRTQSPGSHPSQPCPRPQPHWV